MIKVFVAVVAIAACKSADKAPASSPASPLVQTSPAPPAAAATAISPLTVDPCTVLTRDIAEAYFGRGSLPEKYAFGEPVGSECGWRDSQDRMVDLRSAESGSTFDELLAFQPIMGGAPVMIGGAADRAARRADGSTVLIQAHGKLVLVSVMDLGRPPDRTDREVALVNAIVGRL